MADIRPHDRGPLARYVLAVVGSLAADQPLDVPGATYAVDTLSARLASSTVPDRQLSYTWHSFTPEWGNAVRERVGFPEEFLERVATEPRSKVTFDLEALGKAVKLTIVHDGSEPGRTVLQTASQG